MDVARFHQLLTAFADAPANIDMAKGEFIADIRGDLINGELVQRGGDLVVREAGSETPASGWIINRIARLHQLADRILDHVGEEPSFVAPQGTFLDTLDDRPDDASTPVPDALTALGDRLDRRLAGMTFLCYITSDAGEGKTTLINQLARLQARRYRAKKTDWLLLPIPLAGRTLLAFDDVIVGTLVNRFRFPLLYYDAVVELVRMGVLVPALDGFEEMFVESSTGEAVSALGNLVRALGSCGTLLIAARKAYFEYKSLETQARLYDTIEGASVATARLAIQRWERAQFLTYAERRGVGDGQQIYNDVAQRLTATHPLLTRAVLVKRLIDLARSVSDRERLLQQLGGAPQAFYAQFIDAIIDREIQEKWIDRSGEPHRPLLTRHEHYVLLSQLAQEMWTTSTDFLGEDVLDTLTDVFNEHCRKSPPLARQIRERVRQHALLVRSDGRRAAYSFDHEEFKAFFLGWGIACVAANGPASELRRLLEPDVLPQHALDTATHFMKDLSSDVDRCITTLKAVCDREPTSSAVRENAGAIVVRLLDGRCNGPTTLRNLSFPPDALVGRRLSRVRFERCYFQPSNLEGAELTDVSFSECMIERLDLCERMQLARVRMEDTDIGCVAVAEADVLIYDPGTITESLRRRGIAIGPEAQVAEEASEPQLDPDLIAAQRLFRAFLRATAVNENVLRLKAGARADSLIDRLMRAGILEEVQYKGAGKQRRFRLSTRMRDMERAFRESGGTLEGLIARLRREE